MFPLPQLCDKNNEGERMLVVDESSMLDIRLAGSGGMRLINLCVVFVGMRLIHLYPVFV